jgi:hypothetical protein
MSGVASLMNDTAQTVYTNDAVLPYLNMALDELQEHFELNNVPVTNETSTVLMVPKNTSRIASVGTTPLLPADLVEIQTLWESDKGMLEWIAVTRRNFISQNNSNKIDSFIVWAWMGDEIRLIPATIDKDLKIDYVASIFATPLTVASIATELGVKNATSYLKYKTAALCAKYIGENPTRSDELNMLAIQGMDRALGISTKGRQAILTRRRPFRASYKSRGMA